MHRVAILFLCFLSFPVSADALYTRNLACDKFSSTRAIEICTALEDALKWSWTGHAIISPSFRMNIERERQVYCELPILKTDTSILVEMAVDSANSNEMIQVQINIGVIDLLSMLGQEALNQFPELDTFADGRQQITANYIREHITLTIEESSTSIFNPSHPQYILRDGCS
jgi:hypothetical protein